MNWIVAGLIAGIVAFLADWVMWSKVFSKGMNDYFTPPPAGQQVQMGPMLAKAGVLALGFGVLLAWLYARFKNSLWVEAGGPLAGMEFATVLWLPTIALATIGSGVWYNKLRTYLKAEFWAWLVRMNAAGLVTGLLIK